MKRIILIVISILLLNKIDTYAIGGAISGSTLGETFVKVGAAGSQFLKIPIGARANGLAGAYSSMCSDLTSIFWNPAGLADVKSISADFSYTQWFAGFQHSFGAFALPIGRNFTAAISLVALNSGNIEITTLEKPNGTGLSYRVNDVSIAFTFSGYLTDQFSFGLTGKFVNNSISNLNSSGIAFDVGTMYETGIQGIRLGFSIHNLGIKQAYSGQDLNSSRKLYEALNAAPLDIAYIASSYSLPLIFRAGASSKVWETDDHRVVVSGDFITLSDTPEHFALGSEYTFKDFLAIRAGYQFGTDIFGLSAGVGLKYFAGGFEGEFDYSITPTKNIGLVNRLSIKIAVN
ncbi:MAG: PorV/PorQ family protein [Ignavibacteria bacterium]|nr:PorV/PorQ family protein [Ignavibacteria bacterium]